MNRNVHDILFKPNPSSIIGPVCVYSCTCTHSVQAHTAPWTAYNKAALFSFFHQTDKWKIPTPHSYRHSSLAQQYTQHELACGQRWIRYTPRNCSQHIHKHKRRGQCARAAACDTPAMDTVVGLNAVRWFLLAALWQFPLRYFRVGAFRWHATRIILVWFLETMSSNSWRHVKYTHTQSETIA